MIKYLPIFILLIFVSGISAQTKLADKNTSETLADANRNNTGKLKTVQIRGAVKDRYSKNIPIPKVSIQVIGSNSNNIVKSYTIVKDSLFIFHLPQDNFYSLKISAKGYIPVSKEIVLDKNAIVFHTPVIYLEPIKNMSYNTGSKENEKGTGTFISPLSVSPKQGQSINTIQGCLIDAQTDEPIPFAPVAVLDDTGKLIDGIETDNFGKFSLQQSGKIQTIKIKMLGYKELVKKIDNLSRTSFVLKLQPSDISLSEVVVTATPPPMRVKGDTLEYWAGAYAQNNDVLLSDLLKNIPGMQIGQEGMLMINNKPVNKILINGKEFFGNDIQMALKNIPTEIISKLRVYNKQSDISQSMGIKEISDNQVLDLEVKDEFRKSMFGNAQLGYGSDDRYYHKFMFNKMADDSELTLLGNMNNINNDESGMGADSDGPGLKKTKSLGLNFNVEQIKNLKLESSVMYEDDTDVISSNEITENFIASGNRYTQESSSEEENRKQSKLETSLDWESESPFSVHLRIKGTHDDIKNRQNSEILSYVLQKDTTVEKTEYSTIGYENELSAVLTLGLSLNDKGRNLNVQLSGEYQNEMEKGINKSIVLYNGIQDNILDQQIKNKLDGHNLGGIISYTEPIGDDNVFYVSYALNYGKSNKDKNVFRADDQNIYSVIDSTYSRLYKDKNRSQVIGTGFQSIKEKYEYYLNLNMEPGKYENVIKLGDSLIQKIEQNVINYNGAIRFVYKPKETTQINISYSGLLNQPNTNQLSKDTTTLGPMNKVYGNANLKGSLTNNFNLQFQKSDFETQRFFMVSAGVNFTTNQIVEYSKINQKGNTETTYKNVNGNWGANLGLLFNTPFKNKKFRIDNNITASYFKNTGFINDQKSTVHNVSLSEYMTLNFKSDIISSNLNLEGVFNLTKNNLSDQGNKKNFHYGISNTTDVKLPYSISFQNNIGYRYFVGYSNSSDNSELLWSASASKLLFSNKVQFKVYVHDILNQKKNISSAPSNNKITDITTNSIGRYFLVSFVYRWKI